MRKVTYLICPSFPGRFLSSPRPHVRRLHHPGPLQTRTHGRQFAHVNERHRLLNSILWRSLKDITGIAGVALVEQNDFRALRDFLQKIGVGHQVTVEFEEQLVEFCAIKFVHFEIISPTLSSLSALLLPFGSRKNSKLGKILENAARREAAIPMVQDMLCWATFGIVLFVVRSVHELF